MKYAQLKDDLSHLPGDIWGAVSAAALVLPQAMAFGITLWVPYTHEPAMAALSGLITAIFLCLASGIFRGTQGMVSAPTGPSLVLLAGAMAAYAATGLSGEALITATVLTIVLAGVFQALIGGLQLGHLIKYIPYPVVSGFMTGSAILMILSQSHAILGSEQLTMTQGAWIPFATAAATLASMIILPKYTQRIPGTVLGLVIGTLAFHLFAAMQNHALPEYWLVGHLPDISSMRSGVAAGSLTAGIPWLLVAGSALALAVLASLDSLLTSVVADVASGSRHNARRELMGQGVGHMLSGIFGGMAGAGTTGATLVAIQSGGRKWVGLVTGISILLLIVFMGAVAALLPISVFAGIILYVAIFGMLDKDILRWIKTPQSRIDAVIALIVTAVTVFNDLMVGVGVGVALAAAEFIRTQVQSAVIQRRWTSGERTSLRRRPKKEKECLIEHPHIIVGYELKGTLFFGTTDHLFEAVAKDLGSVNAQYIILDMRRVTQVDLTAVRLIEHMHGVLRQRNGELILASVPKSMGLVKREGSRHEKLIPYHKSVRLHTFIDSDRALEYAENCVIKQTCKLGTDDVRQLPLSQCELLSGFNDKEKEILQSYFHIQTVQANEYLFRGGDHGEALFVLISAEVEVLLKYEKRKRLRLATFGPGMTVGEITFLEPGPRSADGKVFKTGEVAVFSNKDFKRLSKSHADIGMRLLMRLGHDISKDLRMADAELRRLVS